MRIFAGKGAVVLALAMGGLTSFLAWNYVNSAQANSKGVEMTSVVVAAMPIPARTVLTPEMVRIQRMPLDAVGAQSTQAASDVVGKVVRSPMTTDEPVLRTKLFLQRGESGLAFMVPEGMRAVSVGFTEAIASGGMVTPGDHVDIIVVLEAKTSTVAAATGQRPQAASAEKETDTIAVATMVLQDVQVLAVAQALEGEDTRPKEVLPMPSTQSTTKESQVRSEPAPKPAAKTATLAVNPADALKLVLAEEQGKIRLALRRADDKSTPHIALVPIDALVAAQ